MMVSSIDDWKNNPTSFYKELITIKTKFIFDGFPHNQFPVGNPLVEEAFKTIHSHLDKQNKFYILKNLEELGPEVSAEIKEILTTVDKLRKGKRVQSVNINENKHRIVKFPYADTIECALKYADLSEKINRYKFYKDLSNQYKENGNTSSEDINKLDAILTNPKSLTEKVDDLITWDKAYTKAKLQQENNPHDTYHINTSMNLPGYFQRQYTQLVKDDLVNSDSPIDVFIIPSFAPLDIAFFVKTRVAPIHVMGLIDFPFLFADGYKHTVHEFALHDLKHAWDMELFRIKSIAEKNQNPQDNLKEQERIANYIFSRVEQLPNKTMQDCLEFLLFELVHEEGHSYNLKDLKEGLEEPSIYCNDFLARLTTQKLNSTFFGPSETIKYRDMTPFFQQGKKLLLEFINDAQKELNLNLPTVSYETNHHGFCEIRSGEKVKKHADRQDNTTGQRLVTPNISLRLENTKKPTASPEILTSQKQLKVQLQIKIEEHKDHINDKQANKLLV